MQNFKTLSLIFGVLFITTAASAQLRYDPSQLQQFETTGSCPVCDLTDTDLSVNYGV